MTVPLTGTISTYPNGHYPTNDAVTAIDGWRSVPDHATRNSIPTYLRRAGMPVWTQNTTGTDGLSGAWQLNPPPWTGGDTDWTALSLGGLQALLSPRDSCRVATTANLDATYSNGSSGVGATLTNTGSLAALSIDGVLLSVDQRVLVKDQSSTFQNGIYSVTTAGSGSVAWVLTRAVDYDDPSEVSEGTYTIAVEGTTNHGTLWIQDNIGPFVIGTTPITWIQLQVINVGTVTSVGLVLPTSVFSVTGSPVTGSGDLTGDLNTQTANTVWAGPVSGAAAPPSFRDLVAGDLPVLSASTLWGNPTSSPATPVPVGLGTNLSFGSGPVLNAAGGGGGGPAFAVATFVTGINGTPVAVASNITGYYKPLIGSGTLTGGFVNCDPSHKPVGSSIILDILISTDGGATFTSLWHATPANRPTIAAGASVGSVGVPDITSYSDGNLVRLDVIQVGSTTPGSGVIVSLY